MSKYPSINDRDHDLLKKITENTADGSSSTSDQTALLEEIRDNTADIEINAENIDLNTDELEARLGATDESAAVSDTADSGLNGLFKRILQKLSSVISVAGTTAASAFTVQGQGFTSAVSIGRPENTTAYSAGDAIGVADSGTPANAGSAIIEFANAGPAGGHVFITDVNLRIDLSAAPSGMTTFRLHLYNAAPDAILDNAAWDLSSSGDRGKYLGFIDIATPADLGSTLYSQNPGVNKKVKLAAASTSLYGVLQTIGAYTPASATVYVPELQAIAA